MNIGRILLTGLAVFGLVYLTVNLIITGYATFLGFQAQGTPDSERIGQFASQVAPWISVIGSILYSFGAAVWTARRVNDLRILHGVLVAAVAAILGVVLGPVLSTFAFLDILAGSAMLIAGWLGGKMGSKTETQSTA